MLAVILNFSEVQFSSKVKKVSEVAISQAQLSQVMTSNIDHLLQITELKESIFSYLDPAAIKAASQVSR